MEKRHIEVIGEKEETHIYEISIGSNEYEGKTHWSVYKGNTYMNAVFEKSPTNREEAIECAKKMLAGTDAIIRHHTHKEV